jgi:hypothetical protein
LKGEKVGMKIFDREQLRNFFALLSITFAVGVLIYYIAFPGMKTFNGDDAIALYWAKAGYEAGSLISDNFYYSYLLPIGSSLLMQILIPFFGSGVKTYTIGMIFYLLIFAAALFLFFRSLDYSLSITFIFTSITLLLFSSSYTLLNSIWQAVVTYGLSPVFFFLSFALYNKIRNSAHKIKIYYTLFAFTILLSSLNGIKIIALVSLPLIFAIIAERYFDLNAPILSRKNLSVTSPVIIILLSTLVGFIIFKILTKDVLLTSYEAYFSSFSNTGEWLRNLAKIPALWIKLLGVNANDGQLLYGFFGISVLLRLLFGIILICLPIVALFEYKKLSVNAKLLLLIHFFVCGVVLFVCVLGKNTDHERKLIPIFVTSSIFCLTYLYSKFAVIELRRVTIPLFSVFVLMATLNFFTIARMSGSLKDNTYYGVTKELEERGLKYGFAYYWKSQPITAISEFKINVLNSIINADSIFTYYFQAFPDLYLTAAQSDRFFIVVDKDELNSLYQSAQWARINSELIEQFEMNGVTVIVLPGIKGLKINDKINFNSNLYFIERLNYMRLGWSLSEPWGTWSEGNQAELTLELNSGSNELEFLLNAFIVPNYPEQRVMVKINGEYIKTEVFIKREGNILTLNIPDDIKAEGGIVKIEFELPDAATPKSLGINEDTRTLAIGLISMEVK